jgi:hypothetical protein
MKHKTLITQSNYIPWKGYFDAIHNCDIFIVYDDMQYTKRDWRNRNLIKTPRGLYWLTIPVEVKGKYSQKINETKIADKSWRFSHLQTLKQNYSKAPCYKETKDFIDDLYNTCHYEFLTDINLHFINGINKYLKITTPIRLSSEFKLHEERNQRLINICKDVNTTDYYSGPSAKSYMNETMFAANNINVHYFDYSSYPIYVQLYGEFEHGVSILDLIFNKGLESIKHLNNIKFV